MGGRSTGGKDTRLIILRGNSGSGKSTVAALVRGRCGAGLAYVEQDHFRREVLRDLDGENLATVGLLAMTVRFALDRGYDVLLEGILDNGRYGDMLRQLNEDHIGQTRSFYFHLPFAETARRHATRPQVALFSEAAMRDWYREKDLFLPEEEQLITAELSLNEIVDMVLG